MEAHWGKKADTSFWLLSLGAPAPAQPSENHQVKTRIKALARLPGRDWHWKISQAFGLTWLYNSTHKYAVTQINIKQLNAIQPNTFPASIIPFL